jgi:hypothetical protein
MIELNTTYTHYKNKEFYTTLYFCKIQENNIWVKAVVYKPNNCEDLFVRSYKEFANKFSKINN